MSRKRKGCKYCDVNRKDWEYAVVPHSLERWEMRRVYGSF